MPLFHSIYPDKTSILAIWKMEESLDELHKLVTIREEENEKFSKLVHESRQREFLTVRLCLKELTGDEDLRITYNDLNKPDIKGDYFISISHSGEYVCIYLHRSKEVGVDIEQLNERVKRIASRFLGETEKSRMPAETDEVDQVKWLNLHWSAKETLYKVYAKKRLVFSTQMEINAFEMRDVGELNGKLILDESELSYQIHYKFFEDFVLTYCEALD